MNIILFFLLIISSHACISDRLNVFTTDCKESAYANATHITWANHFVISHMHTYKLQFDESHERLYVMDRKSVIQVIFKSNRTKRTLVQPDKPYKYNINFKVSGDGSTVLYTGDTDPVHVFYVHRNQSKILFNRKKRGGVTLSMSYDGSVVGIVFLKHFQLYRYGLLEYEEYIDQGLFYHDNTRGLYVSSNGYRVYLMYLRYISVPHKWSPIIPHRKRYFVHGVQWVNWGRTNKWRNQTIFYSDRDTYGFIPRYHFGTNSISSDIMIQNKIYVPHFYKSICADCELREINYYRNNTFGLGYHYMYPDDPLRHYRLIKHNTESCEETFNVTYINDDIILRSVHVYEIQNETNACIVQFDHLFEDMKYIVNENRTGAVVIHNRLSHRVHLYDIPDVPIKLIERYELELFGWNYTKFYAGIVGNGRGQYEDELYLKFETSNTSLPYSYHVDREFYYWDDMTMIDLEKYASKIHVDKGDNVVIYSFENIYIYGGLYFKNITLPNPMHIQFKM